MAGRRAVTMLCAGLMLAASTVARADEGRPEPADTFGPLTRSAVYVTTYSGTYSFQEYDAFTDPLGAPGLLTQAQDFQWVQVTRDLVRRTRHGLTQTRTVRLLASGGYDGDFPGEATASHCTYHSSSSTLPVKVDGRPVIAAERNPLLAYSWTLPEKRGFAGLDVTGSGGPCTVANGDDLLVHRPGTNGTHGVILTDAKGFGDAFAGARTVHFRSLPSRHLIVSQSAHRDTSIPGRLDAGRVDVSGVVTYGYSDAPGNARKLASLLLPDVLEAVGAQATGPRTPLASGQPARVLVPDVPAGRLLLSVRATDGPVLFAGFARPDGRHPQSVALVPTGAGRTLASAHPPRAVELQVRFAPAGGGAQRTATQAVQLPANPRAAVVAAPDR